MQILQMNWLLTESHLSITFNCKSFALFSLFQEWLLEHLSEKNHIKASYTCSTSAYYFEISIAAEKIVLKKIYVEKEMIQETLQECYRLIVNNLPLSSERLLTFFKILVFLKKRNNKNKIAISLWAFLARIPKGFHYLHSPLDLLRLFNAYSFFQTSLQSEIKIRPAIQQCFLKLFLNRPLENKEKIGVVFLINLIDEYVCLEQKHILRAIHQVIPATEILSGTFLTYHDPEHSQLFVYLEIKKSRGKDFSLLEINHLRKELSSQIKNSLVFLSPSIFLPQNDEEVYRQIIQLSKELRYVHDLPQVTLSFEEQWRDILRFKIIVVCLSKEPSIRTLLKSLPFNVKCIFQRVENMGLLRKKYMKEANLFTLEINSAAFVRENHIVDLLSARRYLVQVLELAVGEIRDYNGGLLLKQTEQFQLVKKEIEKNNPCSLFLLEKLFYTLSPSWMQAILSSHHIEALYSLFLKTKQLSLSVTLNFLLEKEKTQEAFFVVIKTSLTALKDTIEQEVHALSLPSSLWAHAVIENEGFTYFCFVLLQADEAEFLLAIQQGIERGTQKKQHSAQNRKILRGNFQDGDLPSLNPCLGSDLRSLTLIKNLFEGLLRFDKNNRNALAGAQKFKTNSSKTLYTFFLRDAKWSNGEEINAEHYAEAWKKAILPGSPCLKVEVFYPIKNAKLIHEGKLSIDQVGIQVVNSKILQVELEEPTPYFLSLLSTAPYSPSYGEKAEPTIFNGPFLIASWKKGEHIHLSRNPFYWDIKRVHLEEIHFSMIKDHEVAFEKYQNHELDWIGDPFSPLPEKYFFDEKLEEIHCKEVSRFLWIYCNTKISPLHNAKLRRALAFSIDPLELHDFFSEGSFMRHVPEPLSHLPKRGVDPVKRKKLAKALFEEALLELNLEKENFPIFTLSFPLQAFFKKIIPIILDQWEKNLGIKVIAEGMEWNVLSRRMDRREYQLGCCIRSSLYYDAYYYLSLFSTQSALRNWSQWENEEFTKILSKNSSLEKPLQKRAEKILLKEMPAIPIGSQKYRYFLKNNSKDFNIDNLGFVSFKHIS